MLHGDCLIADRARYSGVRIIRHDHKKPQFGRRIVDPIDGRVKEPAQIRLGIAVLAVVL
jgi:hypothetical protein